MEITGWKAQGEAQWCRKCCEEALQHLQEFHNRAKHSLMSSWRMLCSPDQRSALEKLRKIQKRQLDSIHRIEESWTH